MIGLKNLLARRAGWWMGALAGLALGCQRESTGAERGKVAPAVTSAGAAPGSAIAPPAEPAPRGPVSAPPQPDPPAAGPLEAGGAPLLTRTTAAQLLASIAASGKRATLVNAWASWCGPCRRELPMLQALSANLKPQRVQIVLVSVDDPKDEAKAASYLKDSGITLKSYLVEGSVGDFKAGINPSWPGMLPASFLFDASAQLVHFWGGEAFENEITPVVENFLAGVPIAPETRYGLAPGKLE